MKSYLGPFGAFLKGLGGLGFHYHDYDYDYNHDDDDYDYDYYVLTTSY